MMHRSHQSKRVGILQISAALYAAICSPARAQPPTPPAGPAATMPAAVSQPNGDVITMPQDPNLPASRRTGLIFLVDTRWVNAYGYRPVEVMIQSAKPTTTAHTIRVQLNLGWANVTTVEQEFEFPSGATIAKSVVTVPFYEQSVSGYWWDVWVDGVKDNDLSLTKENALRRNIGSNVSSSTVRVLVPVRRLNRWYRPALSTAKC